MTIRNSQFRTVGSYLQENVYWVPDYQREYSWDKDIEVEDFWSDFENLLDNNERSEHFFGQIVVHKCLEDDKYYLIDGQQRTATAVIILSVLNALFEKLYKEENHDAARNKSEDIRVKYLGRYSTEENELKLFLGKTDREYFRSSIQTGSPKKDEKLLLPSHKRIRDAYYHFYDKLFSIITCQEDVDQKFRVLFAYYKCLLENFKVMYVETDDINEAFIIFETLNARGKDLETADLLKNYLFMKAGKKADNVQKTWENMMDNLGNIDPTKFIRHFWNSRNSYAREKDVYKKIRDQITTEKKSEDMVLELQSAAEVYKCLCEPRDESYFSNSSIIDFLIVLNDFGASSFYPIVLACVNANFKEDEINKIVRAIEVLIFKNCVIAGKVAKKYEIAFARIALGISQKSYNADDVLAKIKAEIISDEEFKNVFTYYQSKNKTTIRYILRQLNLLYSSEIAVLDDNDKIHLEHIMPVSSKEWNVNTDEHAEYLWRLGNITLLGQEYNKKIANKVFSKKKEVYEKSKIDITKELLEYDKWDIESISDRQKKMAEKAVTIWAI